MRIRSIARTWLLCLPAGSVWAQSSPQKPPPTALAAAAPEASNDTSTADSLASSTTEDESLKTDARDRFASGLKLYEEGEFALALIEFERAYSLMPNYRVLYNIGQVSIQLGRHARAAQTLRRYIAEGDSEVPEDRKQSVANDLSMLARRTAHLRVTVDVPGAEILLDNDVVARSPMSEPLLVDAGEHRLTVRHPGYVSQSRPLALAGRDNVNIDLRLVAEAEARTNERTVFLERSAGATSSEGSARNRYLLLGWSASSLLGAAWATVGFVGYAAAKDREAAIEEQTTSRKLQTLESRTKHFYLASDLLGVGTLLSAGGMLYYTLASSDNSTPPGTKAYPATSQPATSPSRASVQRLVVSAGPQMLLLEGQF